MPGEPVGGGVRLVLFDLDGTFADTLPDLAAAMDRVLAEAGRPALGAAGLRPAVSLGARAMIALAFADPIDPEARDRHRHRFLELYLDDIARRSRPFPGLAELVGAIERRGARWGIVTNKLARYTERLLGAIPLAERAACVVSGDSAARAKPAPDPLLHACGIAGVAPASAVYVGDAPGDVAAARAAGMPALVAAWGYLPEGEDPASWGPDAIVDAPGDVLAWLDGRASGAPPAP